ncbi:cAMP-responsive element-binding protein-like 2 [Orchesella cincta]|uniref:cAMP-responsive element-binding protein-like 2 n=1 Tax=Orchesella cincta TaxID=48709 RepID=A0A1D2M352_ORCCI|nr:cAMP-responsive element-binding protein-like 2 [Orchesella cincta]
MDFRGGKMMETNEDHSFPMNIVPKEERLDFEEKEEEEEDERRTHTRSLTKLILKQSWVKRSRQSARECRARKKLRYQYLEEIISETEKAIVALRREMDCLKVWAKEMDEGRIPPAMMDYRQACIDRKILEPYKIHNSDILMEESQEQEVLRHVQTVASSPASSGIASASTSAGTGVTTMAFSPTGGQLSAFAAMMLSPSSLTHTISPS